MDILNVYKILKYIALIIIIYFSLRMVNRKLENIDTITKEVKQKLLSDQQGQV